jgi:hypothetical protein
MLKVTAATHDLAVANVSAPSATEAAPPPSPPSTEPTGPDEVDWSTVEVTLTQTQTRQFVTLYQAPQDVDDRAAQAELTSPPCALSARLTRSPTTSAGAASA